MVKDLVLKIKSKFKVYTMNKLENILGIFIEQTDVCVRLNC